MSADPLAVQLALRNRALAVVVATTGMTSLSVTATGYARDSGSFVDDHFSVGMEVLAAGMPLPGNDGSSIITSVTATDLAVEKIALGTVSSKDPTPTLVAGAALVAEVAGSGRSIVAGAPLLRGLELHPIQRSPLGLAIEEEFIPAMHKLITFPANVGRAEETGLYVLKWYGRSGIGVAALRRSVEALKALFTPGTAITAGSNTVWIRGAGPNEPGPQTGQIIPLANGAVLILTVPWAVRSRNVIAA